VLGANAPDIDAVTMLMDGDLALGFRRGWTHGVLALTVLPVLLWGGLVGIDALLRRRRPDRPPLRARNLLALCALAVWTHPALDWLNAYGMRWLMPFDGRWSYGDALFIVDPWLWLLAAAAPVLARARTPSGIALWLALGALTSALVLRSELVPDVARALWCAGVAAIAGCALWGRWREHTERIAAGTLAIAFSYALAMLAGSAVAAQQARAWLGARGIALSDVMAGPAPANPFVRQVIAADADTYHRLRIAWLESPPIAESAPALPRGPTGPIVDAARRAPHVQGLVTWMRFPRSSVEPDGDGWRVVLGDARGLGQASVELDANLRLRTPSGPGSRRSRSGTSGRARGRAAR
jgi:inner membrane protein